MSDKIKVSTEHMDDMASYLKTLGNRLKSASDTLDGIWMNSTTANHTVRSGSCRLSGNAGVSSVSTGSTRSMVRRYSNALESYEDLCKDMAKHVLQVKERFIALEAELSAMVNGDAETIGDILGFPENQSEWTDEMWNQYMSFTSDYKVHDLPGGGKWYSKDGHFIFVDKDGRKTGEYDFGRFLFRDNPFLPQPVRPGLIPWIPIPSPILLPWIPGTPGEGLISKFEEIGGDVKSKIKIGDAKRDPGYGLFKDSKGNRTDKKQKQYKDDKWVDSDEGVLKPEHTFIELGASTEKYGGLAMYEDGYVGENGHIQGKAAFGYGEFKAGGYAGLYGYDKDGNMIIAPGVRGEIGGSVSLLHADVEGAYDFGPVEVGGSGSVDVGKAALEGELQLGWVDNKFAANAGFEAQLLAFEAEGSVSAKGEYLGVKATGGVQVGLGASADVGYHDGVISLELSACVGLGLKGKVELDVSGAVDAVTDACESVYDGAKKAYSNIKNFGKGMKKLLNW